MMKRSRVSTVRTAIVLLCGSLLAATPSEGQRALSAAARTFVAIDTSVVALINARVIDGTGAAAREGQTIVIRDGDIASIGGSDSAVPPNARVLDLAGKTVVPGFVMVHEHLFYPAGGGTYGNYSESFTRLYLAGGVTSMRTGGNMNGYAELNMAKAVARGEKAGPWIDATAPYLNGPNNFAQMYVLNTPDEARRYVNMWVDQGATSFKAYMQIKREVLRAAIDEAHKRGVKVTGHLCSVTYREAAEAGIDNLEHGLLASTDFVKGKKADECPGQGQGQQSVNALDPESAEFKALVAELVARKVALTSTLTVFETFTPGRPMPPGIDVLIPQLKESFERRYAATARSTGSLYSTLFPKAMALELAFARAGGTLVVGTDPTGGGGVIPGYSNQRAIELLVEAGFSPLEAIQIATLNGARYLGRDNRVGSVAVGKQADLVVINGNPAANISDIRKVDLVFKHGIGYDVAKLIASVRGQVGLW